MGAWFRLLVRNRFRIHPFRWPMALIITGCSVHNSIAGLLQRLIYGRRIAATKIEQQPIFIVGHWRSGTTMLHELMSLDQQLMSPTTFACFAPTQFLLTEWMMTTFGWFLVPSKRPMDNMKAGWARPQEDEFALFALDVPTPFQRIAFPNRPAPFMEYFNMDDVPKEKVDRWKEAMIYFFSALTLRGKKRLVLKSPPHTARLKVLSEMFPGARFIHITRQPYELYSSTCLLWESLSMAQGLQIPREESQGDYVFRCFDEMYGGFERQREQVDPSQIVDVRYEDLVSDPVGNIQAIYEHLQLDGFEQMRPDLEAYVEAQKGYQPNRHSDLDPDVKAEIDRRWAGYFEKYGYSRVGQAEADAMSGQ